VVERTIAWINQMRRPLIRDERRDDIYAVFHQLGSPSSAINFLKQTFGWES